MLKVVDDVNGSAKSGLIVVLKVLRYSTDGVTRVTVFGQDCCKVRHRFGKGDCFVMAVIETSGRVQKKVWSCF